jgi:hypothetical protein
LPQIHSYQIIFVFSIFNSNFFSILSLLLFFYALFLTAYAKIGFAATSMAGSITKIPTSMDDITDMAGEMLKAVPSMLRGAVNDTVDTVMKDAADTVQETLMGAASDKLAGIKAQEKQIKLGQEHAAKVAKLITAAIFAGKFKAGTMQDKAELIIKTVIEKFTNAEVDREIADDREETKNEDITKHFTETTQSEKELVAFSLFSSTTGQDEKDASSSIIGGDSGLMEAVG